MSSLVPLREALARGDLRALYLGWLFSATYGWLDADELEPPVPAGLEKLDGPLAALADFLELDEGALEVAAEASAAPSPEPSDEDLRGWLAEQSEATKLEWLMKAVEGDDHLLGAMIRRAYAQAHSLLLAGSPSTSRETRTAGQEEGLWTEVEQLVETYKPRDYDAAVEILVDLRDLHARKSTTSEFRRRLADFKERYGRRSSLTERMDKRGL